MWRNNYQEIDIDVDDIIEENYIDDIEEPEISYYIPEENLMHRATANAGRMNAIFGTSVTMLCGIVKTGDAYTTDVPCPTCEDIAAQLGWVPIY